MKKPFAKIYRIFFFLAMFSIAMGFLEAIVVVYMRQLHYPLGFDFPLSLLSPQLILIEWIRELATIIMLAVIGIIAGKNNLQRFFYFLYAFAIWDIFYYVALKLFLNWPPSFLTWDILFLIPVPWIGPVLAPLICSLTMIFFAVWGIFIQGNGITIKIKLYHWALLFFGSFLIFYSFIEDYLNLIIKNDFLSNFWNLSSDERFWQIISQYVPTYYNWYLFSIGEIILLAVFVQLFTKFRASKLH
ncbi:MAG: hypothetical protein PF484_01320 [Bacteroidales bacterium]|jgi:hypothetical protein|nr:hypothetical protein [Bacteroidales bacterium]